MRTRILWFFGWIVVLAAVFWMPLSTLISASLKSGYSSHIVLIPFITSYLVWSERDEIFSSPVSCRSTGAFIGSLGAVVGLSILFSEQRLPSMIVSFLTVLSALLLVVAGYVWVFGISVLKRSAFPILFLGLMLPVPGFLIDKIIHLLQSGSAHLSASIFSLLGVPVLQNGFFLTIPGITIEVASECSGINSSVALLILMLLFAHETLISNSRRTILVLLIIPLSIVKNAIRIVTLTLLATKVDPGFLTGRLHHEGGFVFFLITLVFVCPVWKLLRASELRSRKTVNSQPVAISLSASSHS